MSAACFRLDGILYEVTTGRKRARVQCVDHCRTLDDALSTLGVEVYS